MEESRSEGYRSNLQLFDFGNSPQFLHLLHSGSAEFRAALNNTAKIILEKGASQVYAGFVINLPQVAGDCKPFDWDYVDVFYLIDMSDWVKT